MPVLFPEISKELGLSVVAIGTIWGMDPLAGVFMGLPGGLLADKLGVKRTLTIVCIFAGIFCALRGFSTDFWTMAVFMFMFGLMAAIAPSIVPKVTAVWFSGKHLALTNGLLNVAWSIGAVIASLSSATFLSPMLGGWRHVLFFFGIPPIILGLLWWFTGREPEKQDNAVQVSGVPFRQALVSVIRIREVWILGFILLTYWGANLGTGGYLPLYLRNAGWAPANADWAVTIFNGVGVLGVIPMVLYSDKVGSRKVVMLFATIVLALGIGLLPVAGDTGVWILLTLCGLIRTGVTSLANTLLFEVKGVGATYAGTAIGLTNTLGMLGAFAAAPIGNSFSALGNSAPLYFWAVLAMLAIPLLLLIKEKRKVPAALPS
jgi:sugar phosphate permease